MVLPEQLDQALDNIDDPGMPHVGGAVDLPLPGLRVKGLDQPVALPLLPAQAEKLAALARVCPHGKGLETVVDTSVRDCLEIDPDAISFANNKFQIGIDNLAKKAVMLLGVPDGNVSWTLYKMLLYKTGGHFKPHRDTEKTKGMFATLTVQLPSCFKGGELVVRHQGEEDVYESGVHDGANEFGSFYTAFFADLEHEILPVKEGYRLALVYSLSWTGQGDPPSADENKLAHVTRALKDHAAKARCGAWTLSFGLAHLYTESSIANLGTNALKSNDRRNVGALTAAAELAGMGPLEVLMCKLTRRDEESGDGFDSPYGGDFHVDHVEKGDVCLETAYCADGSQFSGNLFFVDWNSVDDFDVEFEQEDEGEVEYTGNEGATRETTYGAMMVFMWPKNKDIEVRFNDKSDVCAILNAVPSEAFAGSSDRLLSCLEESKVIGSNAWNHARALLQLTIEHNLVEQTSRGIKFMSRISDTPGVERVLTDCLSTFGWAAVGDALKMYLCPTDLAAVISVDGRLQTICNLNTLIPFEISCQGLDTVLNVLESKWSVLLKEMGGLHPLCSNKHSKKISGVWNNLITALTTFESKIKEDQLKKFDIEGFVSRLIALVNKFGESEIEPFKSALAQTMTGAELTQYRRVHNALEDRFHLLRTERFVREARLAAEGRKAGPSGNSSWDDPLYRFSDSLPNWGSFLSLAVGVLSREPVSDKAVEQFQAFLSALPSFPKADIDSIMCNVDKLEPISTGSTALSKVKETGSRIQVRMMLQIERERDLKTVHSLRGRVKELEQVTRVEPRNVKIRYKGISIPGYPSIGHFMDGNQIEERLTGFQSVVKARKVLKSFQSRLPPGVCGFAGGSGRNSFIKLTKPFAAERRIRDTYEANVRDLARTRAKLVATEGRLRRPVDCDKDQPAQKVAKLGGTSTAGDDVVIVGEKISPKKVNNPDVIVLD